MIALLPVALSYTDVDDNIDFNKLIHTPQLKDLILCLLDKQPCSTQMVKYRAHAAEAIDNACANCMVLQKQHFWTVLHALETVYPDLVRQVRDKYDPEGRHFARLEGEIAQY
ncbi:uncharacterized protein LOC121737387 [Aricia agestis]|uniref:uncharacterized protein LOC121737387 n=1 Tax=Aricia agestis TaxID=91739 RepID=UPI001C20BCCD|nr:uncharacterized protein LOC121737387 [Aricia agestis]